MGGDLTPGRDGRPRCAWSSVSPELETYHDVEWGFPLGDDQAIFETLSLEGFQSGLSWRTILAKRENFRQAFQHFNVEKISRFTPVDVERMLHDVGIVRHRAKIEAVINNARHVHQLITTHGSLGAFVWTFENRAATHTGSPPSVSREALMLSHELRKCGWKFVGPTTTYAFMQAIGIVNGHAPGCVVRVNVDKVRKRFVLPSRSAD